jgi:hypothetical protein
LAVAVVVVVRMALVTLAPVAVEEEQVLLILVG